MHLVKSEGHSVKKSSESDRQIIALFYEIEVPESNADVRILIGIWNTAVCVHAKFKWSNRKHPEQFTRRASCGQSESCNLRLPVFF